MYAAYSTQPDVMDVDANTSYVHMNISNLYIRTSSIYNFFRSFFFGTSEVGCKIIFNCLVCPEFSNHALNALTVLDVDIDVDVDG